MKTRYQIHHTDNLKWLRSQPDNSVDSVVTDPPYGLSKEPDAAKLLADWLDHGYHEVKGKGFMGKEWDAFVPQPLFWKEVFRVLKPGGHVFSFAGARTYDWMVIAMRLAGFEIRDQFMWIYAGAFPKSLNVSKAIDKKAGAKRQVVGTRVHSPKKGTDAYGDFVGNSDDTLPSTAKAKYWDGWGTATSPSHEPIVLARKPLIGTVIENIEQWGTGAINIDGSRVPTADGNPHYNYANGAGGNGFHGGVGRDPDGTRNGDADEASHLGRWPSNLVHDGSDVILELFPETGMNGMASGPTLGTLGKNGILNGAKGDNIEVKFHGDQGSAARYFYCAKPSQYERKLGYGSGQGHVTVKPVALMHHLVKMITPANGVVLDPFFGSGTTGIGAMLAGDGITCIGLEMEESSIVLATARLKHWRKYRQFIEVTKESPKARQKASSQNQPPQTLF